MDIQCHISNISCASCVNVITKVIQKQGGNLTSINPSNGKCIYSVVEESQKDLIEKELLHMGYKVNKSDSPTNASSPHSQHDHQHPSTSIWQDKALLLCIALSVPLVLCHYLAHTNGFFSILGRPFVQLLLCLPVYVIGWRRIGKNGTLAMLKGYPNMNSLIIIGATVALFYSLANMLWSMNELYFFEASATIFTLVLLGNYFEHYSMTVSQKEIQKLIKKTSITAHMIAFDSNYQEIYFEVPNTSLKVGDLVLIKSGEQVPSDCKILSGNCSVNESIITGESIPVVRQEKETLLGGSILISGTVKAQISKDTSNSVIQQIIKMVEEAQMQKPPIQKLADKVSAVFVPLVFGLSVLSFLLNYYLFEVGAVEAILRSICVLVIACPCALGMATPAAIAIGLGIAAKKGIYFKEAGSLEKCKSIRRVVLDKTGTLTKGNFAIQHVETSIDRHLFLSLVYQMEKHSNHPIALSLLSFLKKNTEQPIHKTVLKNIQEINGIGMQATDEMGNLYQIGSSRMLQGKDSKDASHNLYVTQNGICIGWIDIEDEIQDNAKQLVQAFHEQGVETILLSGDKKRVCQQVATELGLQTYYYEKTPEEKLHIIEQLSTEMPTAMVGDGVNDAPSLSKASIGIAVSNASQISIQASSIVLTNKNILSIYQALQIGKQTYSTIVSNLIWAFGYNIVAIPIASMGLLTPTIAALIMGLSDVVLVLNSLRLYTKKL